MTWSELNDWLALYEVDPWGERRADVRSVVGSLFTRGGASELRVLYPYSDSADSDEISVEDEADTIATLNAMNASPDPAPPRSGS